MTHEQEMLALADKIGAWTPSSGMLVFIARERRMIEDALRAAIQPQRMQKALERIAEQQLPDERLTDDGDYEYGYEQIVKIAREALAHTRPGGNTP